MTSSTDAAPFIDRRRTGLLVVDMQEGFCHPESQMEKSGVGTANQRAIIREVAKLVELAREFELAVFWSKQIHFPEDVTRRRRAIPGHMDKQNFAPCLRGTWEVDLVPELEALVRDADLVIEKHRASLFFETTLPAKLRMLGIEQVIICGVTTEFCVETTIRDAYYRDLDVIVVRDCVASPRPQFHEDTLAKTETYWGSVVSLDELPSLFIKDEQLVEAGA